MVLLARSLQRSCLRPASSSRALSTTSALATSRAWSSRAGGVATHRPALASQLKTASSPLGRSPFAAPASIRPLTSEKREKVKVLQVLYDGGKHAEEVSFLIRHRAYTPPPSLFCPSPPTRHPLALLSSLPSPPLASHWPSAGVGELRDGCAWSGEAAAGTGTASDLLLHGYDRPTPMRDALPLPPLQPRPPPIRHKSESRPLVRLIIRRLTRRPVAATPPARHDAERARHPQVARGPGPHPRHHLGQGG